MIDLRLERLVDEFAPMHRDMARSSNTLATSPVHPYVIACGTDLPPVAFVDTRYLKPEDAAFFGKGKEPLGQYILRSYLQSL